MAKDLEKKSNKEKKHFWKDFKAELKKVIWPTPKQVVNNTIAVITIVLITAVIVFALDFVFKAINTYGIDAIRQVVKNDNTVTNNVIESEEQTTEMQNSLKTTIDVNESNETTENIQSTEITENSSEEQ